MDAQGFADFVRQVTDAQYALYQQVSDETAQGLASGNVDGSGWTALADDAAGVNANYGKVSAREEVQDALSAMVAANMTAEANFRALATMTPSTASALLQEHGGEHLGVWVDALYALRQAADLLALRSADPAQRDDAPWASAKPSRSAQPRPTTSMAPTKFCDEIVANGLIAYAAGRESRDDVLAQFTPDGQTFVGDLLAYIDSDSGIKTQVASGDVSNVLGNANWTGECINAR